MLPCQDWLCWEVLGDSTLVAALADGAGTAEMAERGARIAVESAIAQLKVGLAQQQTDFETLLRKAASVARDAIADEAARAGIPSNNFAATLLAIVLTPSRGGALQIGDGVIVVSENGDEWSWVFWPQRGEYVNTTHFLTDEDALAQLEVEEFSSSVTDIALMSDGLESLALDYASQTVFQPFLQGMFRPVVQAEGFAEVDALSNSLERFLTSTPVAVRTSDDVSLILATRRRHGSSQ